MIRPTEVFHFYFILKQKLLLPHNNSSCQIVYNKIKREEIKPRRQGRRRGVASWIGHYYLWACRRARSAVSDRSRVYEYAASIKEQ
jgi:hypothetical protein